MNRFLIPILALLALPSFAQEDSGVENGGIIVMVSEAVITTTDGGTVITQSDAGAISVVPGDQSSLDHPMPLAKVMVDQVKAGNFVQAIGILMVLLIGLFRMFGKKLHDLIPDDSWADKPFWFLLETKPGGWILNFLFVTSGGLGTVWLSGENVTWDILKPIVTISLSAAAIWGLVKDLWEWIQGLKAAKTEPAAPAVPPAPPAPGA